MWCHLFMIITRSKDFDCHTRIYAGYSRCLDIAMAVGVPACNWGSHVGCSTLN